MEDLEKLYRPDARCHIKPGTYRDTEGARYVCYKGGKITLDGDFTADELKFFVSFMKFGDSQ